MKTFVLIFKLIFLEPSRFCFIEFISCHISLITITWQFFQFSYPRSSCNLIVLSFRDDFISNCYLYSTKSKSTSSQKLYLPFVYFHINGFVYYPCIMLSHTLLVNDIFFAPLTVLFEKLSVSLTKLNISFHAFHKS